MNLAMILWFSVTGDILGATELRGPVNFRYKDLKSATKNFSEKYKIGEEGFGDIYKVFFMKLKRSFSILRDVIYQEILYCS